VLAMVKSSVSGGAKWAGRGRPKTASVKEIRQVRAIRRKSATGQFTVSKARFDAVMQAAERSGLLDEKSGRIAGRVSSELVAQAKLQTGIETDTDLIEFALATIALEDDFAQVFKASRGTVDPDLELGF
jgi:hypothetical protein